MKKKKYNSMIIAVAALVVAGGAYLGLTKYNDYQEKKEAEQTAAEVANQTYVNQMDTIQKVVVKNSYGEYSFSLNGENWVYDKDSTFPVDESLLNSIASQGQALTAVNVYEEIDELSAYGLDEAAIQVTFTDDTGKSAVISYGNAVNEYYYCKEGESDLVYTVDSTLYSELDKDLMDFVLLDTIEGIDGDILGYTVTMDGEEYYFDSETSTTTTEDAEEEATEVTTWYITVDGVRTKIEDTNAIDSLVSQVSSMTFTECVEYNADDKTKESYGMLQPACEITVHYLDSDSNECSSTVVIGNETEDAYYGMLKDSKLINLISDTSVTTVMDAVKTITK